MAYTTIKKPSDYFETKLFSGDDTNNREISLGLTPDLTWIKARNVAYGHILFDRIRGLGFSLNSNGTNADRNVGSEFSWSNSGCTTDSFTVDRGSNESLNETGRTMVAWNWKANGTGSANTDGSISSTVSANTTSGFSIVKWTSTDTAGSTIGHNLGSVPKMIITKKITSGNPGNWTVYHNSIGNTKSIALNTTGAQDTATSYWNDTTPTSSVFSTGTYFDAGDYIAYCFAEKQGFSKFGSYTGNGNADGTFVYTGFKPAWIMIKTDLSGEEWNIFDSTRNTFNLTNNRLQANSSASENTFNGIDFLSNGFKLRSPSSAVNYNATKHIYMAFAEQPLVGDNPATAR